MENARFWAAMKGRSCGLRRRRLRWGCGWFQRSGWGALVKVEFEMNGDVPKDAEIYAVIAQDMAATEVKRGENGGRTLRHVCVAKNLVRVGKVGAGRSIEVPMPQGVEGARHVVVFVQEARMGRVVAVGAKGF